jgi:hypothetical protein
MRFCSDGSNVLSTAKVMEGHLQRLVAKPSVRDRNKPHAVAEWHSRPMTPGLNLKDCTLVMIDSPLNWLDANWLYERGADNRRELGRGYRRKLAASSG